MQEILLAVFAEARREWWSYDANHRVSIGARTLLAAALTCRAWSTPALQVLWEESDVKTLLNTLAPTRTSESQAFYPPLEVRTNDSSPAVLAD